MVSNEQIELARDVDATQIPSGIPHRISAGTKVRLMQALGGSYTVMTDIGSVSYTHLTLPTTPYV